ncbi:MAG: imelysin family protein [Woeseiaceae bacterium]
MLHGRETVVAMLGCALAGLAACGGDSADVIINGSGGGNPAPTGFDASNLVNAIADDVMVGTYTGLANSTQNLLDAVLVLSNGNLTRSNLISAQDAWFEARKYWEGGEGFLWGPIDTEGFDPKLDDWPVNKVDLDNILADTSLDLSSQTVIEQLDTTVKGFHTIEYLLFNDGSGNEDTAGCGAAARGTEECYDNILATLADPRRVQYLEGITTNVRNVAADTLAAWLPSGDNFLASVSNAGKGSNVYPSQRAIVEEFVQGIIGIADEVGAGKLGDPFSAGDPLTVESKFSGNSLTDFQYNLRSIRNVYCGRLSIGTESAVNACAASANSGLAELVSSEDPALNDEAIAAIDTAIDAIADIPGPYYEAVSAAPSDPVVQADIQAAIDAVRALHDVLSGELLPFLDDVDFQY